MKIIYIIDRAISKNKTITGSQQHLYDLIKYFTQTHTVYLICLTKSELPNNFINNKNTFIRVIPWFPNISSLRLLINLIKEIGPDIIHAHQPKALLYSTIICKKLNIPSIITIHEEPKSLASIYLKPKYYIVYSFHLIISILSKILAKKIIYVSHYISKMPVFHKKSITIYNWVSEKYNINQSIKCNSLRNKTFKLLSISTLSRSKGYEDLFIMLSKCKNIDYQLDVIGSGDELYIDKLINTAEKKGILNNIIFHGYKRDLREFYNNADAFILFTKSESFGLVFAEAMFFGLPIFASKIPITTEIIPNCNFLSNDLTEQGTNLQKLIDDSSLYDMISKKNINKALNSFSSRKNLNKLQSFYFDLIN